MEIDALVGTSLGQYQIVDLIGKGGMATVYLARQTKINRSVAVKVLPRSFLHDNTFMQRFRREAEIVAGLEHFHILSIYDYGEHDGMPFIVMRHLDGGTVQDRIREGTLTWEEIINIVKQVAAALDYAHSRGVVHRDIKPSNILLDDRGNAYVADFGIAKVGEGTAELTSTGIAGTPAYMAPEQPEAATPTASMDVYALGVTVFEMLTGRLPYVADTPIGQILKHIREPVPSLLAVHPDMPVELDTALQRAMAKSPETRFQSAGEFARAFERAAAKAADLDLPTEGASPYEETLQVARPANTTPTGASSVPSTMMLDRKAVKGGPSNTLWLILGGGLILIVAAVAGITLLGGMLDGAGSAGAPTTAPTADNTGTAVAALVTSASSETPTTAPTSTEIGTATPTDRPTETATSTSEPSATALPAQITQRGISMILIPEGPFTMGNNDGYPNERPEHTINLSSYYMDVTEVTNLYYKLCVEEGGCEPAINANRPYYAYYRNEYYNNYPLVSVTWYQADIYCKWRGGHLPTEAQWEKAARWDVATGTARLFPWDNNLLNQDYANMGNTGITLEVASNTRGISPYGLYDMAGNVAEWVYDWYQSNWYEQTPADNPVGPAEGQYKIYRGGSYGDTGAFLTTTFRPFVGPATAEPTLGFRCASTPSGDPTTP